MSESAMNDDTKKTPGTPLSSALPAEGFTSPAVSTTPAPALKEPTGPAPTDEELIEWLKQAYDSA